MQQNQQPYYQPYPYYNYNMQQPQDNKPLYVMTKSAWIVVKFWHIAPMVLSIIATLVVGFLFGWTSTWIYLPLAAIALSLIPLVIMVYKIINIKDDQILIYSNKVVQRWGILSKHEKTNIFTAILSVNAHQTFWGRFFNYGTIKVDVVGQWDIDMKGIKDPFKARDFLEKFAANGMSMQSFIMN